MLQERKKSSVVGFISKQVEWANLEAPGFTFEFLISLHLVCDILKVLFHLLAQAHVQT